MAQEFKDLIVALDVGTFKVQVAVAEVQQEGMRVLGLGEAKSEGIRRGVVDHIEATVQAIQTALKEAERMADCRITRVVTGITGGHIRGQNSKGVVAVKDKEVTANDVHRVIETAKAVNIAHDQRLLLVEPQEFIIDGDAVRDPVSMSGVRLEVGVHIVTGSQAAAENVLKCVRRCGLEVEQLRLNHMAASDAVLTDDERQLGVLMVDIGAGTTDIAVFHGGAIRHTAVIPFAGENITSDIAMMLRTPTKDAEDIKLLHGCAKQLMASSEETFELPGLGDRASRTLKRQQLAAVIESRVEEIFQLVANSLHDPVLEKHLSSGVVLTGGTALLPGIVNLAEDVFARPVRVGVPFYHGNLYEIVANPRNSTAFGLLHAAYLSKKRNTRVTAKARPVANLFGKVKDFLVTNF